MNVAFDPWIPVMTAGGKRELVSLEQVFSSGSDLADLTVRPHERVALMRLFLCVAHAALNGPRDYEDWLTVPKRLPEAARSYLETWRDWFELFDPEKPWLQVASLSKRTTNNSPNESFDWTHVSKLNFALASGDNSTLFDHEAISAERLIKLEETLISLLSFQCFSPGGTMGQTLWNGQPCGTPTNHKNPNGPVKSQDAPCIPSSMIHALLRDKTLLTSIHINLPTCEQIRMHYNGYKWGRPIWEVFPTSLTDTASIDNATKTYVGRLVPMSRVVLLHTSGQRMLLGNGLTYPTFLEGFPAEPTATVIKSFQNHKEDLKLLSYNPNKAIWRELWSIIIKRKTGEHGGPLALNYIQDLDACDLVASAIARASGQATIINTTESIFHISSNMRSKEGIITYESEANAAEATASRLGEAIAIYSKEFFCKSDPKDKGFKPAKELSDQLKFQATTHYWTTVEGNLDLLFTHIAALGTAATDPTLDAWRKQLSRAAIEAYHLVCGQDTPRQLRAFAKGLQKLTTQRAQDEADDTLEKEEKA